MYSLHLRILIFKCRYIAKNCKMINLIKYLLCQLNSLCKSMNRYFVVIKYGSVATRMHNNSRIYIKCKF